MLIAVVAVLGTFLLALAVLTGLGEHRRGARVPVVLVAGAFVPIAWLAWYLRDERPYRRTA